MEVRISTLTQVNTNETDTHLQTRRKLYKAPGGK